jgi:hypothetical protein
MSYDALLLQMYEQIYDLNVATHHASLCCGVTRCDDHPQAAAALVASYSSNAPHNQMQQAVTNVQQDLNPSFEATASTHQHKKQAERIKGQWNARCSLITAIQSL